jgi:hypothetical protein
MSGDRGTFDVKTVAAIVGIVGALAAAAGSWYVNDYRLTALEKQFEKHDTDAMRKIDEVKCLVAEVHQIPLPECK